MYAALKYAVPTAPPPGRRTQPDGSAALAAELAALRTAVTDLALNDAFPRSAPIRLALLELAGYETGQALTVLGITDSGNRSRTRTAKVRALAGGKPRKRRPARTVTNDSQDAVTNDSRYSCESGAVTSGNGELAERATLVLPLGATDTHVDTDTALEVLRDVLGIEVIASEPRPGPLPVADAVDAWMPADEGPCVQCGTRTCRYGDLGSPLCADCRAAFPVNPPQPATLERCA